MGRRRPLSSWKALYHVWPIPSQPKHISRVQGQESIPTTLLNSRVSLKRFPFLGPMAQLPVTHNRVSSTVPGKWPAFAWALSNHARTSPLGLTSQSLLLQVQLRLRFTMQHICGPCAESPERMCRPCCRSWYMWSSVESKHTHSLDALSFDFQFVPLPAPQRGVRSERSVSHRVSLWSVLLSVSVLPFDRCFLFYVWLSQCRRFSTAERFV